MSLKSIKANYKGQSGFTIVELLIVIVVIGILAAITIVAYNGVTARANTTSAQAAAGSALKKAEAYNAEENGYPTDPDQLTTAASTEVYALSGIEFTEDDTAPTTVPASSSTLRFYTCGGTGTQVSYWNYTTSAWVDQVTGTCGSPVYEDQTGAIE